MLMSAPIICENNAYAIIWDFHITNADITLKHHQVFRIPLLNSILTSEVFFFFLWCIPLENPFYCLAIGIVVFKL